MTKVSIGKKAPAIKGVDQNGATISLSNFKGKKVVLYFYPKDNTPGCTAQACNLRDHYNELLKKGYAVIGVSPDDVKSHKKFEEKFALPFPLIADTDHSIAEQYGVWGLKKFMGREYLGIQRTTFLIDENGTLVGIIDKPDTKNHTEQVLDAWKALS
ncbi:MAG: thioredoxin-dependent thiol peroxidase [Bacteroidota bacterium]|jgi:peroxiredoxin Q/BCP|nr:thioredoxin-dependent thiol peroxidase [Bacteroidota bacterium]